MDTESVPMGIGMLIDYYGLETLSRVLGRSQYTIKRWHANPTIRRSRDVLTKIMKLGIIVEGYAAANDLGYDYSSAEIQEAFATWLDCVSTEPWPTSRALLEKSAFSEVALRIWYIHILRH